MPTAATTVSRLKCKCPRRCKNKGHSSNGPGCSSRDLVVGSDVCDMCICTLRPFCLKVRYNGVRCDLHESVFTDLPFPLQATHLLGKEGSESNAGREVNTNSISPNIIASL